MAETDAGATLIFKMPLIYQIYMDLCFSLVMENMQNNLNQTT